jgi:hypothetical protein
MIEAPSLPYFLPVYRPPTGGVDFLGLRTVNLDMMAMCLPGFNNVTESIRPYSVVAWTHWKLSEIAEAQRQAVIKSRSLEQFRDKVENLFVWSHQLARIAGLPGITAKAPSPNAKGEVSLAFIDWDRKYTSTGLMAAINYGPSSKSPDGLSFLKRAEGDFFATCGEGIVLAKALDEQLRQSPYYPVLSGIDIVTATADAASSLYSHWSVLTPSSKERAAFANAFYAPDAADTDSQLGRRTATLLLISRVLDDQSTPIGEGEIRRRMVLRRPLASDRSGLRAAWLRWFILQLRQAQRISLEALLAWLEIQLIRNGQRDIEALVEHAASDANNNVELFPWPTISAALSSLRTQVGDLGTLLRNCAEASQLDFMSQMLETAEAIRSENCDVLLPGALRTLLLCVVAVEALEGDLKADSLEELSWGGPDRVSLRFWKESVDRVASKSFADFFRHVFEVFVISQHCSIAATRFDGKTHRLRLTIDEEGLVPLVNKPWKPIISPDRLVTALSLMNECGLIQGNLEAGFHLA